MFHDKQIVSRTVTAGVDNYKPSHGNLTLITPVHRDYHTTIFINWLNSGYLYSNKEYLLFPFLRIKP